MDPLYFFLTNLDVFIHVVWVSVLVGGAVLVGRGGWHLQFDLPTLAYL